jgi:Mg2+ and Co2+ transporter CorA
MATTTADLAISKRLTDQHNFLLEEIIDLQKRLDDVKEDINDEIQIAIGAVQVQDAQSMKKQTQETIRQTQLTVALAVLAAIYLPMTLVTGIFGMDIKEIGSDKTATYAWQVVVAWLVIFAFTAVGGSVAYVWWEKRRAKKEKGNSKKESDLEANGMGDESGRWGRKAKQKAKTIRTAKQE